ncbi:hypothetical protein ACWIGI_06925 [Nocardia sp. NPDC055321]
MNATELPGDREKRQNEIPRTGEALVAPARRPQSEMQCGHRVWAAISGGLEIAEAESANRMGVEHMLLHLLRDPSLIPVHEFDAMRLPASVVFARLAEQALSRENPTIGAGVSASAVFARLAENAGSRESPTCGTGSKGGDEVDTLIEEPGPNGDSNDNWNVSLKTDDDSQDGAKSSQI